MEEFTVTIGELITGRGGITRDSQRTVQFTGEKLGEYREYGTDANGDLTDMCAVDQVLYRVADGRLVVHMHEWSRWENEPDRQTLTTVTEETLQPMGLFYKLGWACGLGRTLTLDEALADAEDTERVELTFILHEDAPDREIQHQIEVFAGALVGLNWADKTPLIGRLVDALFGVIGIGYEDGDEDTASN